MQSSHSQRTLNDFGKVLQSTSPQPASGQPPYLFYPEGRDLTPNTVGQQDLPFHPRVNSERADAKSLLDQCELSLQVFIKDELRTMKAAMVNEVQVSKAECLAHIQDIRRAMEHSHGQLQGKFEQSVRAQREETTLRQLELEQAKETAEKHAARKEEEEIDPDHFPGKNDEIEDLWGDFAMAVAEVDAGNLYSKLIAASMSRKGFLHTIFDPIGIHFPTQAPHGCMAKFCDNTYFVAFQAVMIVANTCLLGVESDILIREALEGRVAEGAPVWIDVANVFFNIVFTAELIYRMVALRLWFFVSPEDWGWNWFDLLIVSSSLVTDFILKDIKLSFLRTLRIMRAFRAARVVRMLRFFRQLRVMFFAILACVGSLTWFFVFLSVIMFMTSIFLLQGLVFRVADLDLSSLAGAKEAADIKFYFGSVATSMFSLLAAVSGGNDWSEFEKPLEQAGIIYVVGFVMYVLFVTVGIINVLTGVFLSSATEFTDESLIIQNELLRLESFVKEMLAVFKAFDKDERGKITWPAFQSAMKDINLQAYLSHYDLEPTQARLIFDLLDESDDGEITIEDFVLGMMRLSGQARAVNARIIQQQVRMLPDLLPHKIIGGVAQTQSATASTTC